jgi:hypothetical protein
LRGVETLVSLDAQGPKGKRLDLFHFIPGDCPRTRE